LADSAILVYHEKMRIAKLSAWIEKLEWLQQLTLGPKAAFNRKMMVR
jgi:hypothetical protein